MHLVVSALAFMLIVAALIDVIVHDDSRVRHLPKIVWLILVVLLPVVGSVVWFAAGHDWSQRIRRSPLVPPTDAARITPGRVHAPRSTEEQLAALDREIEEASRIRELEAELNRRRRGNGSR